jgi:hypothetical protein
MDGHIESTAGNCSFKFNGKLTGSTVPGILLLQPFNQSPHRGGSWHYSPPTDQHHPGYRGNTHTLLSIVYVYNTASQHFISHAKVLVSIIGVIKDQIKFEKKITYNPGHRYCLKYNFF